MKITKILHISDLHFGWKHSNDKWISIVDHVKAMKPDLIIITGDVVNTPWKLSLRDARKGLHELRKAISDEVLTSPGFFKKIFLKFQKEEIKNIPPSRVIYVPGNHDTRFSGLIDVIWLDWLLLAELTFSLYCKVKALIPVLPLYPELEPTNPFYFSIICLLLLRATVSRNLKGYFRDMMPEAPATFPELKVGVIPLDSTKGFTWGAQGKVASGIGNILRKHKVSQEASNLFWIAAVHHHPLPIAFDSRWEPAMIMNNAGTILHELIFNKVPLVIHGHKHHQSYSRFLTNIDSQQKEISVLSAGTPTHKKNPSPNKHSFNEVIITDGKRADINIFEAKGDESFKCKDSFSISADSLFHDRSYDLTASSLELFASRLIINITIDKYSHATYAEEFSNLKSKVLRNEKAELPYKFPLKRPNCEVVDVAAKISNQDTTGLANSWQLDKDGNSECSIKFKPHLPYSRINDKNVRGVDFFVEYTAVNFCALNARQYLEMYQDNSNMEHFTYRTPSQVAIEELYIQLNFPSENKLPGKITLQVGELLANDEIEWARAETAAIVSIQSGPTAFAKIDSPIPGYFYRINWEVEAIDKDELIAESREIESQLLELNNYRWTSSFQTVVKKQIEMLALLAYEKLISSDESAFPSDIFSALAVSIHCYDRKENLLKRVMNPLISPRRADFDYKYGAGLVGLSFKNQSVVGYGRGMPKEQQQKAAKIKPSSTIEVADEFDIETDNMDTLAIPLYLLKLAKNSQQNPKVASEPYAILKITFKKPLTHAMADTASNAPVTDFGFSASEMVRDFVESTILTNNEGGAYVSG